MAAPPRKKQQKPQPKPGAKAKRKPSKSRSRKPETPKRPVGHPPIYRKEFATQAQKLCELGAIDADLADFFGVTIRCIERWACQHEEFGRARKIGKEPVDDSVEHSLLQRARGYTFESEKIMTVGGKLIRVPTREHVPPDVTACIFWLKNRRKESWKDKHEIEGTVGLDLESLLKGARLVEERRKSVEPLTIEGTVIASPDETK